MGDRSENAAYKSARQNLSRIDSRSRHLTRLINYGYVYTASKTDHVDIGCFVTVDNGKTEMTYELVGEYEADPLNGKLSFKSPIGAALRHKKFHDTVSVKIPSGVSTLSVRHIEYKD